MRLMPVFSKKHPTPTVLAALLAMVGLAALPFAWRGGSRSRNAREPQTAARSPVASGAPQTLAGRSAEVGWRGLPAHATLDRVYAELPLAFEENQGQTTRDVRFISRGSGFALFLTAENATLEFRPPILRSRSKSQRRQLFEKFLSTSLPDDASGRGLRGKLDIERQGPAGLRMKLVGIKTPAQPTGLGQLPGTSNYFIGRDSRKWLRGVRNYARVVYRDLYPGVDLVYHGNQRRLEYDFVVAPRADLGRINWKVEGTSNATAPLSVDAQGNLLMRVSGGIVRLKKPVVYEVMGGEEGLTDRNGESRRILDARYVLQGNGQFGFAVVGRDSNQTLVIDPVLDYSTYLGGSADDLGFNIAVDSSGAAYITGQTLSTNFPVMSPAFGSCKSCGGASPTPDVFVTKLDSSGSSLVYSTYLGGSNSDVGLGIAVDTMRNAYVTGQTLSTDFPTMRAFQSSCKSCSLSPPLSDAFVTKLDPAGNIVYSTYLGGSKSDLGAAIAADSTGNAYLTGPTASSDFPLLNPIASNNALQGTLDAFVTKFDPNGNLLSSTYLGGSGVDAGFGIAVDSTGIYVAGQTQSNNFPTVNPFQGTFNGVADAFISKLSPDGLRLIYSTFLGGTNNDAATAIAVDSSGSAYVTGFTSSTDFPVTPGAFQTVYAGGLTDAFIAKLSAAGNALVYSTYLGGTATDAANGIAVDAAGNANVVGGTSSSDFPTANPVQGMYNGNTDAFVTRLVPAGCAPFLSTYLGGHSTDIGTGVAADSSGNAFATGRTSSNDFPVTTGAFQGMTGGGFDAFVARLNSFNGSAVCLGSRSVTFPAQILTTTSSAETVTLTNGGDATLNITSVTASGDFSETNGCGGSVTAAGNCTINITFSPMASGARSGAITLTDDAGGSPQSIALVGEGSDFSMTVAPPSATVTAGQTATFTLTVAPISGFDAAVALTCAGAPTAGACSISPTSVTPSGNASATASVTVTTAARSGFVPLGSPKMFELGPGARVGVFLLLALSMFSVLIRMLRWRWEYKGLRWLRWSASLAAILIVALWSGCNFNSNASRGTPAGTYTVTAGGAVSTLQRSVRFTLNVN